MRFFREGDTWMVTLDDGTTRKATIREIEDNAETFLDDTDEDDANVTGFDVVRRATEGR